MPEFTVKEVRLPELHLPEIKRDEIARTLSGIRVPEVERAVRDRRSAMQDRIGVALQGRLPRLSAADVGRLIAAAIYATRLVGRLFRTSRMPTIRRSRRGIVIARPKPRRPFRGVIVVTLAAAAAGWVVMRSPVVRLRVERVATRARNRIEDMRAERAMDAGVETGEPVAITTTEMEGTAEQDVLVSPPDEMIGDRVRID